MNESTNLAEQVRFGTFELNVRTGELVSIGTAAAEAGSAKALLREQPFQILRILVERQGKIVTRQEIRQILWPDDTVVEFDRSINVAMAILRKALADDADHPKYIETLARRGYRLIAPVEWQESSTAAQGLLEPRVDTLPRVDGQVSEREPRAPKYSRKAAVLGASAVILVVVGYMSWRHFRDATPPRPGKIMLAVLPFENLTGDPSKEYLADGLTEETISELGRLNPEQLGVIARTSVMGYKHKDTRLDQIGHELSVQYVLENSLRESGNHIRLTSQLIQVKDQTHLWSRDYDYPAKDILTIEDDVAKAVAQEIRLRLTSRQQAELAQAHRVNPEAFDAYLQGYYFFERNTDKDTEMAGKYYERATQLDPSYALAWVGLSRVRKWQAHRNLIPSEEGFRLAREAVERALALNPNLAAAHTQMGRIKQQLDFDWAGGDASYQRAAELEPGNPEAVTGAASSAAILGRFDEALRLNRRAVDLDPLNAGSWESLGETEYFMGQLDEAVADVKKSLELNPDVFPGPLMLGKIYVLQGRPQDALPEIERVRDEPQRAFLYAIAYYALGRKKESDAALSELIAKHPSDSFHIAEVYAFRNESNEAFEWLDRAYAQRNSGLIGTKVDPLLKSLHHEPRYAALLKKLNFPT
jgi:TolB-like protein/DNA-binding winged helix-turn-helix (wHTH) protein/tetratricopeptide (TPR) repeat protein